MMHQRLLQIRSQLFPSQNQKTALYYPPLVNAAARSRDQSHKSAQMCGLRFGPTSYQASQRSQCSTAIRVWGTAPPAEPQCPELREHKLPKTQRESTHFSKAFPAHGLTPVTGQTRSDSRREVC